MAVIIEFAPALAFFTLYQFNGLMPAVAGLMVCQLLSMLVLRLLGKPLTRMHYLTLSVVLLFGSMTLLLRNPVFILIKPTVFYGCAALGLTIALLLGKNPARTLFAKSPELAGVSDRSWQRMAWQWVALAVVLASINLVVAYTMEESSWVTIKTFGFMLIIIVVFVTQTIFIIRLLTKTPLYRLRSALTKQLAPEHLDIRDDSADHLGHAEAATGGHFHVTVVSLRFNDLDLIKRHRQVYDAVGNLADLGIHALSINALTPVEYSSTVVTTFTS